MVASFRGMPGWTPRVCATAVAKTLREPLQTPRSRGSGQTELDLEPAAKPDPWRADRPEPCENPAAAAATAARRRARAEPRHPELDRGRGGLRLELAGSRLVLAERAQRAASPACERAT